LGLGDGSVIEVYGVAGGADGALAVIGRANNSDSSREPFLAWISPDRKQQNVTQLNPYFPGAVAIAADGSVWTAGLVNVNDNIPDHMIIRRFDKSGKMLAAFFPWKANPPHPHPADSSYLLASRDRVGWYLPLFGNGYFEFSLEGKLLGRFQGARPAGDRRYEITGAALSENDELLVSRWDRQARKWEVLCLDRAKRTWTPVQLAGEPAHRRSTRLLGFDGENLLTSVDFGVINYYKPQSPSGTGQ